MTCTSLLTYDVELGLGKHARFLDIEQLSTSIRFNIIANAFGVMAYSIPNIAVAILLNRMIVMKMVFKIALFALVISQCIFEGIASALPFAQCSFAEHVGTHIMRTRCLSTVTIMCYSSFVGCKCIIVCPETRWLNKLRPVYTAFAGIVFAVLCIKHLCSPESRSEARTGLTILMSLTFLAAVCAIVKITKLYQYDDMADLTYSTVDISIWTVYEIYKVFNSLY